MRGRWSGPGAPGRVLVVTLLLLALVGCGAGDPLLGPSPREARAGLYLTGTVEGRQITVSDGGPRLFLGDCHPAAGPSDDVCFISHELDGRLFVLLLRNPLAFAPEAALAVSDPGCTACDDVTEVAVIDVRMGEGRPLRATGGTLLMQTVEEGARYAGRVRLEFDRGRLSGEFDVVPRPD